MLNESSSTCGYPFKLFKPRSRSDCRKRFFGIGVINVWNSLSYDTVSAESLNVGILMKRDLGNAYLSKYNFYFHLCFPIIHHQYLDVMQWLIFSL